MSTDTALAEHPRKRGGRTDSSIKKLPNGKGWRARPTLGTDPVTGRAGLGDRATSAVEHRHMGAEVHAHVR